MKKILFVCTGNTCRSVMAEWFFNKAAGICTQTDTHSGKQTGLETKADCDTHENRFSADSAGISAYDGEAPSSGTVRVLGERYGITERDIGTRSKTITKDLVDRSDLVLTMTRRQRDHVMRFFPESAAKVFTLNEYVHETDIDIEDPYSLPDTGYTACAEKISTAVSSLLEKLGIDQKRI